MTVTPADLALYLTDPGIDVDRAQMFIDDTTLACQRVVNPLPFGADVVIRRVAGRGYVSVTSARQQQLAAAGGMIGTQPGGMGGVWLSDYDKDELLEMAAAAAEESGGEASGAAFSISMLPAAYAPALPVWDVATYPEVSTS